MLVAAFEVQVRRPRQLRTERQHGLMARARVEPHVQDVALAHERRRAARGTRQPVRQELLDRPLVPRVRAVLLEHRGRALDQRRGEQGFATRRAVDRRDGDPPRALARNAPVGPVGHHVVNPVPPPGRNPRDVLVDRMAARHRAACAGRRPHRSTAPRPSARTTAMSPGRSPGCGSASNAGTGA